MLHRHLTALALIPFTLAACSESTEEGTGSLDANVQAEEVIQEGLQPGDEPSDISDGWTVDFEKYIVSIGPVELTLPSDDLDVDSDETWAVDLTQIPPQGFTIWSASDLKSGRWDLSYDTSHGATNRHESVSESDFEALNENEHTYIIAGEINQEGGFSCPPPSQAEPGSAEQVGTSSLGAPCYANESIKFSWSVEAEAHYGPCEVDEVPGVSISSGSTSTAALTIHGDHIFFNGFPTGSEGGIRRVAQWLADADLDLDGTVTVEELESIAPSDLLDPEIYQLGGSPITPLDTMLTYVSAQLSTQGHFQGEGECPIGGEVHSH